MTLIEAQKSNQRTFIKKRLEALHTIMKNGNSTKIIALNYQNPHFKQFSIYYDKAKTEYHITNLLGNGCSFVLGTTYMSIYIDVKLYDLNYRYKLKSETEVPFFLYRLLEEFENIEREYLQLIERFNRLKETANIIRKRIEEHFLGSGYSYNLTETDNKILLVIPLRNGVQLSIPVYYSKYEQILPYIITTVKAYEDVVSSSKIKVFIEKSAQK